MMARSIRARMALASVLPVLLVVLTTVGIFWQNRVQDLEASHQQRVDLLLHQAALFSAYGLFAGNTASLQSLVADMQRAPGVEAVQVFDAEGVLVAGSGHSGLPHFAAAEAQHYIAAQRAAQVDVCYAPVLPTMVPLDDPFSLQDSGQGSTPQALGYAVVAVSRQALEARERNALLTALWVGLGGILVGGLAAFSLGRRVVQPLVRVSQMVQRIGRGNFAIDQAPAADAPLRELQTALNQMARRLAWSREDLERQVADVTQELRQKKEQAESATLAKSRFLAAASHDLRQPLHALGMFVARLGQMPLEPPVREVVDSLENAVLAMQNLLDGLLDLSRLDAGHMPVRMEAVHLNDLLYALHGTLNESATAKGLRLRIRPTHLWVHSDALLLQRMLLNLAINAIRYTQRGTVLVACRLQGGGEQVRIEVRDSGIGIAPEHHEDIFQEFYQLASPSGDRSVGLGLGLNIVQRSATLLGHGITLQSGLGCGTRFSILLQRCAPAAGPSQTAAPGMEPLRDLSGLRVLLIEDDPSARAVVGQLLLSWGCQVAEAADLAQAAQAMAETGVPDVILSDYHLGSAQTGMDCIAALRAQAGRSLPACLMSGETQGDFLQKVSEAGLPLLHKPVRPAKLRSLLRNLLA